MSSTQDSSTQQSSPHGSSPKIIAAEPALAFPNASVEQAQSKPERVGIVVIHGVGETDPGWINSFVVDRIVEDRKDLAFEASSDVFALRDPASSDRDKTFNVFVRRGEDETGRQIAVMELFWADLSRIGSGMLTSSVSAVRLFYEAPLVFGSAALRGLKPGALGLLGWLVLFANWMLRWPITGINVAVFCCCISVLIVRWLTQAPVLGELLRPWLHGLDLLPMIVVSLVATAALGLLAGRQLAHRDIALADVGLSTFGFSLMLLALALFFPPPPGDLTAAVPIYLDRAQQVIMPLWALWTGAIVLAIVVLGALSILRLLRIVPGQRVALARPAAALGLSTIQGMIWKVVISLLWVFMIGALLPDILVKSNCATAPLDSCKNLTELSTNLIIVALSNTTMAAVLVAAFGLVLLLRGAHRGLRRRALLSQSATAPRLVVSRIIIVVMFALTLFNAYNFYGPALKALLAEPWVEDFLGETARVMAALPFPISTWLETPSNREWLRNMLGVLGVTAGVPALLTYVTLVKRLQDATAGMLHAARDVVDHQYTTYGVMSRWILPRGKWSTKTRHPRRERVQKRLDALMDSVVAGEKLDRVVFVAHSQGSVILLDYLMSGRDERDLAEARRIDVVTLASPLSHLYRYYFPDYDRTFEAHRLNPKLASWTNFWRIDDPIGNRVDILRDGFVTNIALPPGGHIDYWKERKVRDALLALVTGEPRVQPSAAQQTRGVGAVADLTASPAIAT